MGTQGINYPIYIVSKGRFKNPLTAKFLMAENIDFKIVVEPQEYNNYCDSIGKQYVLKLPFSNLGLGSYPARNFIWEHSIKIGAKKHWIFDDNIYRFRIFNAGKRDKMSAVVAIKAAEKLDDRYKNIAITGFNYTYLATKEKRKAFTVNCHVYSAMLITNNLPFRWRLKYNEDVDLCLQALHNKYCTILISAYLIQKVSTVNMMKGGNQDELYKNNNPKNKALKAKMLEEIWPQYVKSVVKFNRPHHSVSWGKHFTHKLIKK